MKASVNLFISILMAGWLVSVAIFSIQNISSVSLKFFLWQSIQLPVGVLLSFCAGIGMIFGGFIPFFWSIFQAKK